MPPDLGRFALSDKIPREASAHAMEIIERQFERLFARINALTTQIEGAFVDVEALIPTPASLVPSASATPFGDLGDWRTDEGDDGPLDIPPIPWPPLCLPKLPLIDLPDFEPVFDEDDDIPLGLDEAGELDAFAILAKVAGATAQEYTVTWTAVTANPAIGDGVLVGRFMQIGKLVYFSIMMIAGATTTFGTGAWIFTLPVASTNVTTQARPVFTAYAQTAAAAPFIGVARASTTTTLRPVSAAGAFFSSLAPFVWAAGDFFNISGCYEAG